MSTHVVFQISTAFLGDEDETEELLLLLVNLPINLGAADLYHALETMLAFFNFIIITYHRVLCRLLGFVILLFVDA